MLLISLPFMHSNFSLEKNSSSVIGAILKLTCWTNFLLEKELLISYVSNPGFSVILKGV